jgi:fibronectin-binding autotransporter adhesin
MTAASQAQTAMPDGNGNITISGTGNNAFVFGPLSTPPLASGGTLTIPAGASTVVGGGSTTSSAYAIQILDPSTTSNSGSLRAFNNNNFSGGPAATLDLSPLTTAGNVTIQNNSAGMISASSYMGSATAVDIENVQQGSISITNSGQISAAQLANGQASTLTGIFANDSYAQGAITFGNTGTISAVGTASNGYGAILSTSGSGGITVTNSGTITEDSTNGEAFAGEGLDLTSSGSGAITVNNGGTITASSSYGMGIGVNATATGTGAVTITNSGHITTNSEGASQGIFANATSAITITNSAAGTISATSNSGSAYGIGANSTAAGILITNAASITATGSGSSYGIKALAVSDSTLQNSGAVTASGSSAYGITFLNQTGALSSTNTGVVNATASGVNETAAAVVILGSLVNSTNQAALTATSTSGSAYAYEVEGAQTISTNSGTLVATGSVAAFGTLSFGYSADATTNTGAITATSSAGYTYGIHARTDSHSVSVTNSGTIVSQGATTASGIYVRSLALDATITNTGNVTATGGQDATGLFAEALGLFGPPSTGIVTVINSGHVVGISQSGSFSGIGVHTIAAAGMTTVTNSGYAGGFNTNGGTGYGIEIDPTGPIVVSNTGTAIGTTTGIYLLNAGTVHNSGLASGGVYSIYVLTGSTVNLNDASPIIGLLKGGSDDTSTSLLNFNLKVRGNVAAAKAELDAAIAQYNSDLAAMPKGPQDNVRSATVVLNGFDYQWEDFFGISDNLIQARLYADTPGFGAVGAAIDNFNPASVSAIAILAALDNLPDSAVAGALAQLSPQSLQVLRNIAFDNATFTAANVNNHLANLRDGLTGFDTSGFTVNTPGVDPSMAQMKSRLLAWSPPPFDHGLLSDSGSSLTGGMDMKDAKTMVNTQPVDRWSAFISGSVILANLDNTTTNIGDADYTTGSVMAGVDYRFGDHFTVGALFDYSHTSATLDGNGSKATVDSYAPGIYASYVDKGWYGNAMLMYGFENNTDDRNVTILGISGTNHGAADGGQVTSNVTGGYEFQHGKFKYGPFATLQYVHLTVGSLQEQGPTSLSIDRQEADSLRSQLGFEARYSTESRTPLGLMTFTPHFQATWQHEYMDNSDGISSQFNGGAGGGSFIVQGRQPARDSAFLDLGIDAQVAKNVTIFVDYQTQAGESDFFAQSAQGGVRIGF